jgi:CheY-like chemotaxis protein
MEPMKRILIAEDQTDIRDLLALNLQGAGYQVVRQQATVARPWPRTSASQPTCWCWT